LGEGIAFRIPAGSVIGLQIHYTTTGKEEKNQMSVGFKFPRYVVKQELHHVQVTTSRFEIPPGAAAHPVQATRTLPFDATGLGMFSHMHLRGKDMTFKALLPSGESQTLLSIPNYHYDWQQNYRWQPGTKKLPKGTKIEVTAHFDNSKFNPFNPDATKSVRHGPQTVQEMMFGFFFYTADGEDLNLTIDPKSGAALKAKPAAAKLDAAFDFVRTAVANGDVPGAIALVTQHGKVIREEAFGLADVENKIAMQPNTLCWIASITKPVTVAAAMKLIEEGKLGLDDPVEKWLPEFAELKDKEGKHHAVTIRQLMSHTSGIQSNPPLRPSFFFAQEFLGKNISEISTAISETQLQFEPGSKSQYSNAAPYVLARVIEVRSGKKFHEHVREAILEPAGMRDSYFIVPASEGKRAAVVYRDTKQDGKEERVDFFRFDPNWTVRMTLPDGGLFSSPRQIAKFLQVFLDDDGRVLAKSSVKAMRDQQTPGWGLGWALEESGAFHHSGSSGVTAWADPKTGVVGVLFCQLQNPAKVDPLQVRFRELVREAFR
jgi:CubicO group peptidase (beta-lactamase class C family)